MEGYNLELQEPWNVSYLANTLAKISGVGDYNVIYNTEYTPPVTTAFVYERTHQKRIYNAELLNIKLEDSCFAIAALGPFPSIITSGLRKTFSSHSSRFVIQSGQVQITQEMINQLTTEVQQALAGISR